MSIQESYMLQAIDLAKKGRGRVAPNPLVGCVIVKDQKIIGEGYHRKFGESHAEVDAINNCTESPHDADLYVTLEPCSIFSKTPPCVDYIISNSIKNVFIGSKDLNPKINGEGIEKLKIAGVNVYEGILENKCYELNKGFFNWIKYKKPWVIVKLAQSKNGYIGFDNASQVWITGKDTNNFTHKLRSKVDAIFVGRRTAQIDNPRLTVRNMLGSNPIRVIADTNRKLPLNLTLFNDNAAKNIVLCSDKNFEDNKVSLCKFLTVKEGNNGLDEHAMLDVLGQQGITTLLLEGGRKLVKSFMEQDLIDEIYLYTSKNNLDNGKLLNPVDINDEIWTIINEKDFNNDHLVIARKKELCFQE